MHPFKVGTKTNKGIISGYKYVRFGIGKYRYFIEGAEESYPEDEVYVIK